MQTLDDFLKSFAMSAVGPCIMTEDVGKQAEIGSQGEARCHGKCVARKMTTLTLKTYMNGVATVYNSTPKVNFPYNNFIVNYVVSHIQGLFHGMQHPVTEMGSYQRGLEGSGRI